MKLTYVDLCGFRGYRTRLRIEFASDFTIIDGRNGVGKSTVFDAIEFALTGHISKYSQAKADGETVANYLWWTGDNAAPAERYVEVGFCFGDESFKVRRSQFESPDPSEFRRLLSRICDSALAPEDFLVRLCATAIIRDEHIAGLSLDLKETERYALLRDGLGANDADAWIGRASRLVGLAKQKTAAAQLEVGRLNTELAASTRRVDEVQSNLVSEEAIGSAVARIRALTSSDAPIDQLVGVARQHFSGMRTELEQIDAFKVRWGVIEGQRSQLGELKANQQGRSVDLERSKAVLAELGSAVPAQASTSLSKQARDLLSLARLGRELGLRNAHCPLCDSAVDHADFLHGIELAEQVARSLDANAVEQAKLESLRSAAETAVIVAARAYEAADLAYRVSEENVRRFDEDLRNPEDQIRNLQDADVREIALLEGIASIQRDVHILESLRLSSDLEKARREEAIAEGRLVAAQTRAGTARKAEGVAQALHDASRRAAGETLDRRLDRVLPLMSELYRRLKPHPIWRDIEYSIRGDVRRFLKLQVGNELNPQFLFSSGQRRATGLAFLLSVNLSLAWSRLSAIMLDDPVQHVDDFRTIHLAELAAQLITDGRQIICSVEDSALADLLCRRLPVREIGRGKRITLGPDVYGDLGITSERQLAPMIPLSLGQVDALAG